MDHLPGNPMHVSRLDPALLALAEDAPGLQRLARAIVRNAADAEDAVQEAWRRVLARAQGEGDAPSAGWFRGVVRNVSRELVRSRGRRATHERAERLRRRAEAGREVDERLEAHRSVSEAMARLDEPFRTALAWRYLKSMSAASIARRLGVPDSTVRWRLQEGLRRLRRDFEQDDSQNQAGMRGVVALAGMGRLSPPVGGAIVASQGTKWGIGLGSILLVGLLLWALRPGPAVGLDSEARPDAEVTEPSTALEGRAELAAGGVAPESAPAVDAEAAPVADPFHVSGRVVDERRAAVAHARVRVHVHGVPVAKAVTDAEGRYGLDLARGSLGPYAEAMVEATTEDGRHGAVAARLDGLRRSRTPIEPIVVLAARRLDLVVRAPDGAPAASALVTVERRRHYIAWRTSGRIEEGRTDAEGRFEGSRLLSGAVHVHAWLPGVGHRSTVLHPARTPGPQVITLRPTRRITVKVVDFESREPIPGVDVRMSWREQGRIEPVLPQRAPLLTDAEGLARFDDVPADSAVWMRARKVGHAGPIFERGAPFAAIVAEDGGTVLLGLRPHTTLRLPIEGTAPEDGTKLEVHAEVRPPELRAWIEGGQVCIHGAEPDSGIGVDPEFVGTVETPDGAFAEVGYMAGKLHEPIVFERPEPLRLQILQSGGRPLAHADVEVRPRKQHLPALRTDAQGLVEVRGIEGEEAHVTVPGHETMVFGMWDHQRVGVVALPAATDPVVLRLADERVFTLAVTIDGKAGLPRRYRIMDAGKLVHWERVEEEPEAGLLHIRRLAVLPPPLGGGTPRPRRFTVHGEDVLSGSVTVPDEASGPLAVRLRRAATLDVRVMPASYGDFRLGLERRVGSDGPWKSVRGASEMHSNAVDRRVSLGGGIHRYVRLDSGTYRVRDWNSNVVSDPVTITAGEAPATTTLDMSAIVRVRGRIVFPEGWRQRGDLKLEVDLDGVRQKTTWSMFDYRLPRGHFVLRVPDRARVRVLVSQPGLIAREAEGVSVVAGSGDALVLHLDEPEGRVRFELEAPGRARAPERVSAGVFVAGALVDGVHRLEGNAGTFTLPEAPQGEAYRVVIDPGAPWVPFALGEFLPGKGTRDLGSRVLREGGRVAVAFTLPEGKARPMMRLTVEGAHKGLPWRRSLWKPRGEETVLTLTGVPPGTHRLRIGPGRFPQGALVSGGPLGDPPPEIVRSVTVTRDGTARVDVALDAE